MTEPPAEPGSQVGQGAEPAAEAAQRAERATPSGGGNSRIRVGAVVAVALVAGVVVWLLVVRHSSTNASVSTTTTQATTGPVVKRIGPIAMSGPSIRAEGSTLGQPVYWAGAQPRHTYEFTRTTSNNVYVRYLPDGVKAGAPGAHYLIVATYPDANAYKGLLSVANGKQVNVPNGGIALVDSSYPKSVHMAFPGVPYQIEVFDPSPAVALRVATSGKVSPAG